METMAQTLNAVCLKYDPATDTILSIVWQCTVSAVWSEHAVRFVYRTALVVNNAVLILVAPIGISINSVAKSRSQWPPGLRRRSAAAPLLGWRGSNPAGGMDVHVVSVVCCQVEGRRVGLIARPEESDGVCHLVWSGATVTRFVCTEKVEEVRLKNKKERKQRGWLVGLPWYRRAPAIVSTHFNPWTIWPICTQLGMDVMRLENTATSSLILLTYLLTYSLT
jgi:hypothetical protein